MESVSNGKAQIYARFVDVLLKLHQEKLLSVIDDRCADFTGLAGFLQQSISEEKMHLADLLYKTCILLARVPSSEACRRFFRAAIDGNLIVLCASLMDVGQTERLAIAADGRLLSVLRALNQLVNVAFKSDPARPAAILSQLVRVDIIAILSEYSATLELPHQSVTELTTLLAQTVQVASGARRIRATGDGFSTHMFVQRVAERGLLDNLSGIMEDNPDAGLFIIAAFVGGADATELACDAKLFRLFFPPLLTAMKRWGEADAFAGNQIAALSIIDRLFVHLGQAQATDDVLLAALTKLDQVNLIELIEGLQTHPSERVYDAAYALMKDKFPPIAATSDTPRRRTIFDERSVDVLSPGFNGARRRSIHRSSIALPAELPFSAELSMGGLNFSASE